MNKIKKNIDEHNDTVEMYLKSCSSNNSEKPDRKDSHAELFDTHPIARMKDLESIGSNKTLMITDSWKADWTKNGVQVPTKCSNEQKQVEIFPMDYTFDRKKPFNLPDKLIRSTNKHKFDPAIHEWRCKVRKKFDKKSQLESQFLYEIDMLDSNWLELTNQERRCLGLELVTDVMLEAVIEIIERLCFRRIQSRLRDVETEFLEHDENSKCDICQSPDGEDNNELVFCEDCFVCVHQACYGIPNLPDGIWVCRFCEKKPSSRIAGGVCVLCPNKGGAMKPFNHDPDTWGHVSCAVWIPELGFGDVEKMEPIVRYSSIPSARWSLRCHLCKQYNIGAPIQCSDKKCKMAFHVTCGIKHDLLMKQEINDSLDVKLTAYCKDHSRIMEGDSYQQKEVKKGPGDIRELRIEKQKELELKFHELVSVADLRDPLFEHPDHLFQHVQNMPLDILQKIFTYWKLKRISRHHQCLIEAPPAWSQQHQAQRITNRTALATFCKIRFGLDRARLIMDLVKRREKMKAKIFESMCEISRSQITQLRGCLKNPILKEDPSLAANWGFIVNAHLDNNAYVNPNSLLDPNIEQILKTQQKEESIRMQQKSSTKPFRISSKSLSKKTEKLSHASSTSISALKASNTPKSNSNDKNNNSLILLEKTNLLKPQTTGLVSHDIDCSCVSKLPDDHLIIREETRLILTAKLREPMFFCSYLVNEFNSASTQNSSANSENILILDVPEESDSSNQSSTTNQSACFNRKRKMSDCILQTPASKLTTVKVSPSKLSPRNLFDDILSAK